MKAKKILVFLLSLLTIGCLLAGCASQQSAAATPNTAFTDRPRVPAQTEDEPSIIIPHYVEHRHDWVDGCYYENAEERAKANGWVCLNDYLTADEDIMEVFDNNPETAIEFSDWGDIYFSCSVEIYGIELTFQNNYFNLCSNIEIGNGYITEYLNVDYFLQFDERTVCLTEWTAYEAPQSVIYHELIYPLTNQTADYNTTAISFSFENIYWEYTNNLPTEIKFYGKKLDEGDTAGYIQYDQCFENAQERCKANEWVCLNEYLLPTDEAYAAAFDGNPNTVFDGTSAAPEDNFSAKLQFDRPVEIWGAEFVFQTNLLSTMGIFRIGIAYTNVSHLVSAKNELLSVKDNPTTNQYGCFIYKLPSNVVWIELTEGQPFTSSNASDKELSILCEYTVRKSSGEKRGTPIQEIRLYGRVLNSNEIA